MAPVGLLDLPYDLRKRIYSLAADDDTERIGETRVNRRKSPADNVALFRGRGHYGLTQTCRLLRREFRPVYMKNRIISVHLRDADDYLDTLFPDMPTEPEGIVGLLIIRTEARSKDDYPHLMHVDLDPLLRKVLSVPALQFRFTQNGGASFFNNIFVVHREAWKLALENDIKSIDIEEPTPWGMRLVLSSESRQPWLKECLKAWVRLNHMPKRSLEYLESLGFSPDFEHFDMIFVRRSSKLQEFTKGMTSSHSWKAKKSRDSSGRLGSISDNASLHSNRPLLAESTRGSFSEAPELLQGR